jgi:hypothetical protein
MKNIILLKIVSCLFFFSCTTTAMTIYTDEVDFNNHIGQRFTDDYDSEGYQFLQTNEQMSAVHNQTKYAATGFPDINIVSQITTGESHYYCAGCNGSFQLDFTDTSLSDEQGIFGVGINFKHVDTSDFDGNPVVDFPDYVAYVTFGNNSVENFTLPAGLSSTEFFWAITSEDRIQTIHFGLRDGLPTQEGDFSLLDLTIGNKKSAVSEPNALLLLFLGITSILIRRKFSSTQ